jgi:hypothetical protein
MYQIQNLDLLYTTMTKVEGETTQQIIAKDINYMMDQEKLRRLIGAHTPVPPPRIKDDDMQTILGQSMARNEIQKKLLQVHHQKKYYINT